ncbi:alpha-amylase family protein [Biformimicrobium ophioploci]|uniref:Alpha-amylase family protein n=1 Tax=Biformimicrobium ophioploci TaxID=3036711 RepID=A0ABQ6M124_9GAMM|nr:alpha-amylase family protein [Microbulbifer sp. NKW57]GMG88050.1 alpha-amylase family protein [Microbulbifer sp. NKW57]
MIKKKLSLLLGALVLASCSGDERAQKSVQVQPAETEASQAAVVQKPVVYQVFTRLFGNTNTTNKQWGTREENGVGKFADFTDKALQEIRAMGVTHIWYTGVPHHALVGDYTEFGIDQDDPDVVKGRAGSPYAVRDYYSVNPDLAQDPARRLEEFEALIERSHKHGLKVVIDIVPNHVARNYRSLAKPEGVEDFGANDDTSVEYAPNNDFYYVVGQDFRVPEPEGGYQPIGGEAHPLADGVFDESPAKWTGNGARAAQPGFHDWYETVKINYGVRPDGSFDFPKLPAEYAQKDLAEHFAFWQGKDVPPSWKKFRDITQYWLEKGVDGFRYDMAEMVPVEFWSYLNSAIKATNPDAFLLAEVYNPDLYRDYLYQGKMDYLYDKVGLYDTLKPIMQGRESTDAIVERQREVADIDRYMLRFLENHDEQRIASPDFAGDAEKARPAMVVSATIGTSATMLYFGQDVGEKGEGDAGFGDPTRTTIFDYWGVPAHQRWMNGGAFDGGQLSEQEKALRDFYKRVLNLSKDSVALRGEYIDLHQYNRENTEGYSEKVFAFARAAGGNGKDEKLVIVANFDSEQGAAFELQLPAQVQGAWELADGSYPMAEQLYGELNSTLQVEAGKATVAIKLQPLESVVLKLEAAGE